MSYNYYGQWGFPNIYGGYQYGNQQPQGTGQQASGGNASQAPVAPHPMWGAGNNSRLSP
jgi:hypothetical protein